MSGPIDAANRQQTLVLTTSLGAIHIRLRGDRAPQTVEHFVALVRSGVFAAGAAFYRTVRPSSATVPPTTINVIQGGVGWDHCEQFSSVAHEPTSMTGLSHVDGAVSIGRWVDRGATSELFICIGDQRSLDARDSDEPFAAGFAVFGQVVEGMDVVRAIHAQPSDAPPPPGHARFAGQFLTDPIVFTAQVGEREPMQSTAS